MLFPPKQYVRHRTPGKDKTMRSEDNMAMEPLITGMSPPQPGKRLSFWAIVVVAANTMNGPGLTTLPAISLAAGTLTQVFLVVVATLLTCFVVRRLCLLMWTKHSKNLGNSFDSEEDGEEEQGEQEGEQEEKGDGKEDDHRPFLEESDLVALAANATISSPEKREIARKLTAMAMMGCALALALAQMMLCAKIADAMIVATFGKACGINVAGSLYCTSNLSMQPFASDSSTVPVCLLTWGLIVASSITVSLASVDLDAMLNAQFALFGCLLLASLQFFFTLQATQVPETPWDDAPQFVLGERPWDAVGPILFNFAFVVTAPPLSCGAPSSKSAIRALCTSCVIMGFLYSCLGWIGSTAAAVAKDAGEDTNLLSLILRGTPTTWDYASVIIFGISQLAAIPVYCELARETFEAHLPQSWLERQDISFYLCHVAPWLICVLTYNSTLFEMFVEWSSLLLLGFCNFSMPLILDIWIKQQGDLKPCGSTMATVSWVFALVTATIAAVIIQRMTNSLLWSELAFLMTIVAIVVWLREEAIPEPIAKEIVEIDSINNNDKQADENGAS